VFVVKNNGSAVLAPAFDKIPEVPLQDSDDQPKAILIGSNLISSLLFEEFDNGPVNQIFRRDTCAWQNGFIVTTLPVAK
jgi:hypothetical protein